MNGRLQQELWYRVGMTLGGLELVEQMERWRYTVSLSAFLSGVAFGLQGLHAGVAGWEKAVMEGGTLGEDL